MIKIEHTFFCDHSAKQGKCPSSTTESYTYLSGMIVPIPHPPKGWQIINSSLYCPLHEVTVKVVVRRRA